MPRLRQFLGAVALLLGTAAPTALSVAPVHAAGACTPQGVTVVVDFGALGGGVQRSCASSGGSAAALFGAAHHTLGRVQSQLSAVCSIDSKPAKPCAQMPPANAYWGLFWTDGSSSRWTYASLGVDSLDVPAGGSVAFAWQSSAGTRSPGVAPVVTKTAAPAAKPTKASKQSKPRSAKTGGRSTKKPAATPSATPTPTAGASVSASASTSSVASASPTAKAKKKRHAGAPTPGSALSSAPSASPTAADSATSSTDSIPVSATSGNGGLPGWVAPVVVVVVLAAGGGVAVARRRARG